MRGVFLGTLLQTNSIFFFTRVQARRLGEKEY